MSEEQIELQKVISLFNSEVDVLKYEIKYLRQSMNSLYKIIHGTENEKLMNDLKKWSEKLRNEEEA